jgi:BMFP domain-containing protein YqiC
MPPPALGQYRLLNRLDLEPSFMSLGLPPSAFKDGSDSGATAFDAILSGPTDTLWLFKGEDFLGYDLRLGEITRPQAPIAPNWAGGALPGDFALGLDSACWAGPGFPGVYYLFRGERFVRLDAPSPQADPVDWVVTQGPLPITQEWLRGPSADGVPRPGFAFGPAAKLYGVRADANRIHFLSPDGLYARHNLENGEMDVGPVSTTGRFALPDSFGGRVDAAFYGAGAAAEHIFFLSGFAYAEFDVRTGRVVHTGALEERFPQLALFIARPQLFLVEEYSLDTFIGPLTFGGLVSTMAVPAQSRKTSVVVTQITTHAATAAQQNLLESQSRDVVTDFYKKLDRSRQSEASSDSYQYRLNAMFHGDAAAHGFWGGEVNADLAVEGGSDEQRQRTARQAFESIGQQARESTHTVDQRVTSQEDSQSITQDVLSRETFEISNTTLSTRNIEFMQLMQPYVTLLVLKNVKAAYTDGTRRPEIFALGELDARLRRVLADEARTGPILAYIRGELARVQASSGEMRAIIDPSSPTLAVDGRVRTSFTFPDVEPAQTLELFGIVKAAKEWRQPTFRTRAIDVSQDAETAGLIVSSGSMSAQPEISPEPAPLP